MEMKKVYIIKKAPVASATSSKEQKFSGDRVSGYKNIENAIESAKRYAATQQCRFVVFESVAAFEPAAAVREVLITEEEE